MKKIIVFLITGLLLAPAAVMSQGCMDDGGSDEGVNVKGYIQPQFDLNQTIDGFTESSFRFNRARIGFIGSIPYDVSYYVFAELSPFKYGYPYLLDAFVTYSRLGFAKMSMGQFKSPFSLEQNTPCHSLHTINRSRVVDELASPQRDLGFMVSGGHDTFFMSYSFAVMNGTGIINMTDNKFFRPFDNNMGKDYIGRVVFHPFDFLKIGGSFLYGTSPNLAGGDEDDSRMRYGGEVEFKMGNILVQGEYIYAIDKGSHWEGGGCGGDPVLVNEDSERAGMFVQATYMTPFRIQPVIKYENFDNDATVGENTDHITTFGVNYFLNDWTRIQVNYLYKAEDAKEVSNDCILFQIQAKF